MAPWPVLIVGGYGETGRRLAALLAARTDVPIILAGRDGDRARDVARELNARLGVATVSGVALDARDMPAVRRALAGVELVVLAAVLPARSGELARAALAAGADWLDFQFDRRQARTLEALAPDIAASGCCFVTQGGFHPGLPALLVRWAAGELDDLDEASVGAIVRDAGGFRYTSGADELIAAFRDYRALRYEHGAWRAVRGLRAADYPRIDFGPPFGRRVTFPMDFDELHGLPARIPSLERLGFSIAGFDPVTDWLVTPSILAAVKVAGTRPRGLRGLGKLLAASTRAFARPPYGTVLTLDAGGPRGRAAVRVSHASAYELTAMAGASMIEQMLDGSARCPGLHHMGLLADPRRTLADLEAMGAGVQADSLSLSSAPRVAAAV